MGSTLLAGIAILAMIGGCVRALPAPRTAPPVPAEQAAWNQACTVPDDSQVLHHEVALSLSLGSTPAMAGEGKVSLRAQRATSVVVLDARGLQITSASAQAHALRFAHVGDRLCVELPHRLPQGGEVSLSFAWSVSTQGKMPRWSEDQVWAGYRASAWMPTKQDPAQRATLSLRIIAPAELTAVASGRLVSRVTLTQGVTEHAFVLDRPSPPFLYAFAVGDFETAERMARGVRLRALGPKAAKLSAALTLTASMYDVLVERTGFSLPSDEYTQVFVHGEAAQEGAGIAMLSESALELLEAHPEEDWLFAHELAHQWFAWLIPCADWSDFWLNEGFATFFVAVVKEQRLGRNAYARELSLWRERSGKVHAEGRDAPVSLSSPLTVTHASIAESDLQATGVTYSRGALVLHRLRSELGELAFWAGMRRYVQERAGKGARSEDLRAALEATSGRDLREFFSRWVYSAAPDL